MDRTKTLLVLAAGAAALLYFGTTAASEDAPAQGGDTSAGFGADAGVATGAGYTFNLPAPQAAPDLSGFFEQSNASAAPATKKAASSSGTSSRNYAYDLAGANPSEVSFDSYGQGSSTAYAGSANFQPATGGPGVYVAPPTSTTTKKATAPATVGGVNNYMKNYPTSLGDKLSSPTTKKKTTTNYLGFN